MKGRIVMAKRTKRSKKRDEIDNENDPFSILSLDVLVEILLKLPAKSIAKLIFVSRHWSSIIRSKDFSKLYITRSFSRPRLLFVCDMMAWSHYLDSCSLENPSSDHQRVIIPSHPDNRENGNMFSAPVRGLICLQNGTKLRIGNPSTGQFLTLPRVKTSRRELYSFFCYDLVNDVYKVLCMTNLRISKGSGNPYISEEHQVFTLGPKQKWRKIECNHPHCSAADSRGVCGSGTCINGVVYYYARINNEKSLISFNLISEEFNIVKPCEEIRYLEKYCLVNYGGKLALCNALPNSLPSKLNLWVLQDGKKHEWSEVSHLVSSCTELSGSRGYHFNGALSTGQLIFKPHSFRSIYPYFVVSYDPKEDKAKKVVIETIGNYSSIGLYLDHIESPMVL